MAPTMRRVRSAFILPGKWLPFGPNQRESARRFKKKWRPRRGKLLEGPLETRIHRRLKADRHEGSRRSAMRVDDRGGAI